MNLWSVDRIMDRLNDMLEHAIAGEPVEACFDETKMSALETKLAQYLKMNQLGKQQLQEEKERINELISDISHQTKTPIANMLLYTELLEEQLQGQQLDEKNGVMLDEKNEAVLDEKSRAILNEKSREMLAAIHLQAEKLSFLTQALVKASRLESGVIQAAPGKNAVEELLERSVLQVEKKAALKNIKIDIPRTGSEALFDMKWTGEAVGNILDNAVKYTDEGGEIAIAVSEYPLFVRIDIKDNGIGIAEDDLPKIFGRFYKCQTTRQEEGVGLGLYLARKIIADQGGYIKVKSRPEQGTCFSVFLKSIV